MQTTSHFIGIELKNELFSNIFIKVYNYLKENNIESFVIFQNPLSTHITLYYLEKNIDKKTKNEIKKDLKEININKKIKLSGFDYFYKGNLDKSILYFTINTNLLLEDYRNDLNNKYNRNYIEDNNFEFSPHITFFKILDSKIFEEHRENIENIIFKEIQKVDKLDFNSRNIFLYAVNSGFKEEIQIKL